MDFKSLEKASRKIEGIKRLDAEIIELDKLAIHIANGNVGVTFSLAIEDFDKAAHIEAEKEAKNKENPPGLILFSFYQYGEKKEAISEAMTSYKNVISIPNALQMLGVLLNDKMAKKQELIDSLCRM